MDWGGTAFVYSRQGSNREQWLDESVTVDTETGQMEGTIDPYIVMGVMVRDGILPSYVKSSHVVMSRRDYYRQYMPNVVVLDKEPRPKGWTL